MRSLTFLATTFVSLLLSGSSLALSRLSDDDFRNIPSGAADFDIKNGKLLAPILIPRVPGTEGNRKVQQHFVDFFKTTLPSWELIWQNSTSKTPVTGDKDIPFSNLVFRRDPPWTQAGDVGRLTLVAHFDSKYEPAGFIGATDSAAPCAMLMHVARSIDEALTKKWKAMQENGEDDGLDSAEGVQIIFLDGEEAFLQWTHDDSCYGARSLASTWEDSVNPSMSTFRSPLDSISLFVLLDLLGGPNTPVPSYFSTTHWAYQNMGAAEKRMRELKLLSAKVSRPFFTHAEKPPPYWAAGSVEDDHVPFMQRGVDILHLIPTPFPHVWHKMEDDGEHLDLDSVDDWAKIVTAFTVEWMDLKDHMPKRRSKGEKRSAAGDHVISKTEL